MSSASSGREQAVVIPCAGHALLGIVHHPQPCAPAAAQGIGVVVIVGGPQYRAGSHRQFVHLARALAARGHAVLRFDVQGMGDSTGALHGFEQITPEIGAAIDALLHHAPQLRQVVLWGLCDASSAALLYLHERDDPRVRGLCLLNPWVRSPASLARTQVKHYYLQRLLQPGFWAKAVKGRIGVRALRELAGNVRTAASTDTGPARQSFQQRMATAWNNFDGAILIVLSGHDYTAKEFTEYAQTHAPWPSLLAGKTVTQRAMADADHTFSTAAHRAEVAAITMHWLECLNPTDTAN